MWSHLSCPVIENIIWIEPLLRGHLSFRYPSTKKQKQKTKTKTKSKKQTNKKSKNKNKTKQIKTQQNKTKTKTKNQRKNSYLWNYGFVCLYTYEFWLSLWNIVRSSSILLLPLFILKCPVYVNSNGFASCYCYSHINWHPSDWTHSEWVIVV